MTEPINAVNRVTLEMIQIVFMLLEGHMGHKTVTINHIKIIANHIIYIITKPNRNMIVFKIEIRETTLV